MPHRNFKTASRSEVPTGRKGKHNAIVAQILTDLQGLDKGLCLKIPLADLPDSKVNVRSALNRATRSLDIDVATATDDKFLFIWNV